MGKFNICIEGRRSYRLGESITVRVSIRNNTGRTYCLMREGTPFSVNHSDCMNIFYNGEKVPYDSIRAKHVDDIESDYLRIEAKETVETEIAMAERYLITEPGKYYVDINGVYSFTRDPFGTKGKNIEENGKGTGIILDVTDGTGMFWTRGMREHFSWEEQKTDSLDFPEPHISLKPGNYPEGFEESFREMVLTAHYELIYYLEHCVEEMNCGFGDRIMNMHYRLAFGEYERRRFLKVRRNLQNILDSIEEECIEYKYDPYEDCCVYTIPGNRTVFLCEWFVKEAPSSGTDSRTGAIFNALTDIYVKTENARIICGREKCLQLAETEPEKAIMNAGNYELYVESVCVNWGGEMRCPGTEDALCCEVGSPTAVEWNDRIYLFYTSENNRLCMSVFDGNTFKKPVELSDEAGNHFKPYNHPECIVYEGRIYLFYIPDGEFCLYYTCLQSSGLWKAAVKLTDGEDTSIMPETVPQPIICNGTIYLFYKKIGMERFFYTFFHPSDSMWEPEEMVSDLAVPDREALCSPAAVLYHNVLYLFYLNRDSKKIYCGFYDKMRGAWILDRPVSLMSDLRVSSQTQMRAEVLEDSIYLYFCYPDGSPAFLFLNGLICPGEKEKLILTGGERLERNARSKETVPKRNSLCALSSLYNFNYMFYQSEEDGIFCKTQMNGVKKD